jgi:hypothetical protein
LAVVAANVAPANVAPVLTAAAPSLGTTTAATAITVNLNTFVNNGPGTTDITSSDGNVVLGAIALTGTTGDGVWSYSLDGTSYNSVGAVTAGSALLLPPTAILQYTPDGSDAETATVTYCAWDQSSGTAGSFADTTTNGGTSAFSTATDTASLAVVAANVAPVLTAAAPSLGTTTAATAITVNLNTFINNGPGTTDITSSDGNGVLGAIALTGTTGDGVWSYSLDGTSYNSVGAVTAGSALLLPPTAILQYTPDGSDAETATVTYCAWDQSSGTAGACADTTTNGGTSAFSTATDTASLAVVAANVAPANVAPVLTAAAPSLGTTTAATAITVNLNTFIDNGSGTTNITSSDGNAVLGAIALTGTTGDGVWSYSLDGTSYNSVGAVTAGSALLLPPTAILQYTPDGSDVETATVTYCAWDQSSGTAGAYADTTTNGGTSAFSTATDTASLNVTAVTAVTAVTTSPTPTPSVATNSNATGTASLFGYVYLDTSNSGVYASGDLGISGVSVALYYENSQGVWSEVSPASPTETSSTGAYSFTALAAGNYQVREAPPAQFLDGKTTAGQISGATTGTVGGTPGVLDQIQVTVGSGQSGTGYDFGLMGLQFRLITLQNFLAPIGSTLFQGLLQPVPSVNLAGSAGSSSATGFTTTYTAGGSAVGIAAATATVASPGSAGSAAMETLSSMKVTLVSPPDGASEVLSATTTDTSITQSFSAGSSSSNGVLTLTGVAYVSTYETVLNSIMYSDSATTPQTGIRSIDVAVDDGTLSSSANTLATSTVTVDAAS